jgi:hypothetical protein
MCNQTADFHCYGLKKDLLSKAEPKDEPKDNYIAETRFSLLSGDEEGDGIPFVGIAVNIDPETRLTYFCFIDLEKDQLVLATPIESKREWHVLESTNTNTISQRNSYRIRVSVNRSSISCQLMDTSVEVISAEKDASSKGTPGVVSNRAKVCFDYLLVLRN